MVTSADVVGSDVTVVVLFDGCSKFKVVLFACSCSRFKMIAPGPVNVTEVGSVVGWHARPPVHVQLENVYPAGTLHADTVALPKSVLKNEPPLLTPGVEQEFQFTDADEAGLVRTLTRAAYTAVRRPLEFEAVQSVGLDVLFEHATPSAQAQWSNAHAPPGLGRFAVAPKFAVQADDDWKYVYVLPQAVIEAGDVAPTKLVGDD